MLGFLEDFEQVLAEGELATGTGGAREAHEFAVGFVVGEESVELVDAFVSGLCSGVCDLLGGGI